MVPEKRALLIIPTAVFVFMHGNVSVQPHRLYRENDYRQNYYPQNNPASVRGWWRSFYALAQARMLPDFSGAAHFNTCAVACVCFIFGEDWPPLTGVFPRSFAQQEVRALPRAFDSEE